MIMKLNYIEYVYSNHLLLVRKLNFSTNDNVLFIILELTSPLTIVGMTITF
jgi:hypothetical protein